MTSGHPGRRGMIADESANRSTPNSPNRSAGVPVTNSPYEEAGNTSDILWAYVTEADIAPQGALDQRVRLERKTGSTKSGIRADALVPKIYSTGQAFLW